MLSLRTVIARSAAELDTIAPLWNELLRHQEHTIFQRFSWNRLAAEMFCDRMTPHVVCLESDSGAAIIPAVIAHSTGHVQFLGEALFDYRDVLHAGDGAILRLAWQRLGECARPLRVVSLHESAAKHRWTGLPLVPFARAPQVERSAIDEEAFRLAHSRLGRQMRRLQRRGVALRRFTGANSDVLRRLYDCKRMDFAADTANLFVDRRRCEFMVAAAALEHTRCDIFTLEDADARLIAGLVTFRDRDVRRFYTIYFHPAWARYSPGVALLYEVTAQSLGQGLSCDYLTGEYPYKLRLANSSRLLYKVELSAPQMAGIAGAAMDSSAA